MAKPILIVDDDADPREATQIVLTGAGYEMATAARAEPLKAKVAQLAR